MVLFYEDTRGGEEMKEYLELIVWLFLFLGGGILILKIGLLFEPISNEGMVVMYMIGFLIGSMVDNIFVSKKRKEEDLKEKGE